MIIQKKYFYFGVLMYLKNKHYSYKNECQTSLSVFISKKALRFLINNSTITNQKAQENKESNMNFNPSTNDYRGKKNIHIYNLKGKETILIKCFQTNFSAN